MLKDTEENVSVRMIGFFGLEEAFLVRSVLEAALPAAVMENCLVHLVEPELNLGVCSSLSAADKMKQSNLGTSLPQSPDCRATPCKARKCKMMRDMKVFASQPPGLVLKVLGTIGHKQLHGTPKATEKSFMSLLKLFAAVIAQK